MESSHQTHLKLQQAVLLTPTPKTARAQPAEMLTLFMGPSGTEIEPEEQDEKLRQLLDFLEPRGPCSEKLRRAKTPTSKTRSTNTRTIDGTSANTPAALSSASATTELRPVSVAPEIFLNIIRYLEKPYKLQGYLPDGTYPDVFFLTTRSWADITALQICHMTRMQAIRSYGKPSQHVLPFDPSVDSLSLEHALWICDKPGSRHTFDHGTPHKCCIPLGLDLLSKVQYVEILAGVNAWNRDLTTWVESYLASSTSIRTLRLNLHRYDTCRGTSPGKSRHYPILRTIFESLELLKTLEILQVNVTGTRCNNIWEMYYALNMCHIFPPRFYRPVEAQADTP